ncbi:BlaI/MecI/CopY family transcriptional regulator [Chitinimonas lacunae]|uniref:BlaI/MecI/CopY family transcriptional regulator n=1 Tax=Chitinimonas lacunae TaxID=1963018 RepID=A0ABV8MS02_9NEIS
MTRTDALPKPTPAELDLLRVLWQIGPATAKQVHQTIQTDRPEMAYANVLRQLQLMHAKGLLSRDESQRSHIYAPVASQDSLQSSLLRELIHKVFSGSGKALVLAALRGHVTEEEKADIERFLDEEKRDDQGERS